MAIMPQRYKIILTQTNKKPQSPKKTAANSVASVSFKTTSFHYQQIKPLFCHLLKSQFYSGVCFYKQNLHTLFFCNGHTLLRCLE